jgi:septum formation protein
MVMIWKEQLQNWHVVLASGSPRRKELLSQIGIAAEVKPSRIEEATEETEPDQVVMELSRQKAEDVAAGLRPGSLVIGADTVVAVDGEILGKPGNHERAYEMIKKLSGKTHQVYTGVTVFLRKEGEDCHGVTFAEKTDVHVYPMSEEEIWEYAKSEEPLDKAGAYGIQGKFASYIKGIDGDYANVVGLPLGRLCQEIKELLEDREDD